MVLTISAQSATRKLDCNAICTTFLEGSKQTNLRTARPPSSLYLSDSAWAIAHSPLFSTLSAYSSTLPWENSNRFWTTDVSSRILRPCSPAAQRIPAMGNNVHSSSRWTKLSIAIPGYWQHNAAIFVQTQHCADPHALAIAESPQYPQYQWFLHRKRGHLHPNVPRWQGHAIRYFLDHRRRHGEKRKQRQYTAGTAPLPQHVTCVPIT